MQPRRNSLIIVMIVLPGLALSAPVPTPRPDPCAAAMEGPDYVPGVDAEGHDVPRADIGAPKVALPDTVYVPLRGQARGRGRGAAVAGRGNPPYAAIDGRRLEPLVNPAPCPR